MKNYNNKKKIENWLIRRGVISYIKGKPIYKKFEQKRENKLQPNWNRYCWIFHTKDDFLSFFLKKIYKKWEEKLFNNKFNKIDWNQFGTIKGMKEKEKKMYIILDTVWLHFPFCFRLYIYLFFLFFNVNFMENLFSIYWSSS